LYGSCDAVAHVFGPGQQFILFQLTKRTLQVTLRETPSKEHSAPEVLVWLVRIFYTCPSGCVRQIVLWTEYLLSHAGCLQFGV
jgi:hypothetical protein